MWKTAVKNAKAGQVRYRTDKAGIIHCPIGRADFEVTALTENLERTAGRPQEKRKPASSKGQYVTEAHGLLNDGTRGYLVDRASVDA